MDLSEVVARVARGARTQELASDGGIGANHVYRVWADEGPRILKIYGSAARERRERRALGALKGVSGLPVVLESGRDDEHHWALFADAGNWSLASLPENASTARRAGALLRGVHDARVDSMSNLARGIDQEWVTIDFISTLRRLERYRGRLDLPVDVLESARSVRPPFASEPVVAHTNPTPGNFVVDDDGAITLINWEWATLAPLEWDLAKAQWLIRLQAGHQAAQAFAEGYGAEMQPSQLDRWTVYHAAMMLVAEAEARIQGRLDDLAYLVDELGRAVAGSTARA